MDLSICRRLHFCYFLLFRPFLGSCIFIIFGGYGHSWAAAFDCSRVFLANFRSLQFLYFRRFALLLFSAILFIFRRMHSYFFCAVLTILRWPHFYLFRPFCPFLGGYTCIFFIRFAHLRTAMFSLFLAVFGRLHFYYLWPLSTIFRRLLFGLIVFVWVIFREPCTLGVR